ncbi:hypothetical protein Tco_1088415, partial [Tanacetum coccineum]
MPFAEVHLTAQHNVLANEQQHIEQSEPIYDTYLLEKIDSNTTLDLTNMCHMGGEIVQDAEQYQVKNVSRPRFASQVDEKNDLSKTVTPHYLPKVRESAAAKPHQVNAPNYSRNSHKESYGSNDMVHAYFLEDARKMTQDKTRIPNHRDMASTRAHCTPNACTPKPRNIYRSSPVSKCSGGMSNGVPLVDHSRNSSFFLDSKQFVCSICHKYIFNTNHDDCITKILNKVNSRAKVQSLKIRNNNPVEPKNHTHKPGRQIGVGQRFSLNKSSAVHEKPHTPRSYLRWKPTSRIFKTVSLRWIPTGKMFTDSTTKVDSEPPNGSNDDITNPYECNQTLYFSAGTSNSSAGTSVNPLKERLRASFFILMMLDHISSSLGPHCLMMSVHISSGLVLHLDDNTMAELNVPTQPPTRTDEQIVPRSQWLIIGKSNLLFNAQKIQKNPIFQISVDILSNTNFFRAFTASANVPAIYLQQFWNTMKYDEKTGVYRCQIDEQWFDLSADLLRKALAITPVIPAQPFELPPSGNTVIDFVNELGYPEPVEIERLLAVTNPVTQSNVDHAELLWEEFTQGIQTFFSHKASHKASLKDQKKKVTPLLIPYGRFSK